MKIPEIKGRNKIRDFEICRLFREESKTQEEIGKLFNLTKVRIGQILIKNKVLLMPDKEWEKFKRIAEHVRVHPDEDTDWIMGEFTTSDTVPPGMITGVFAYLEEGGSAPHSTLS